MFDEIFEYPPTIDLLQSLVPGLLKQKGVLAKAVRAWVIGRSLYGSEADPLKVNAISHEQFTCAQWQRELLKEKIFLSDERPSVAVAELSLGEWLFHPQWGLNEQEWKQEFCQKYQVDEKTLNGLFLEPSSLGNQKGIYPFQVEGRTLRNDFKSLAQIGWLKKPEERIENGKNVLVKRSGKYQKVKDWERLIPKSFDCLESATTGESISTDLFTFFENFGQKINGVQRFFIDVEYLVPLSLSNQVEELQQELKALWTKTPVPPVKLTYRSAKLQQQNQNPVVECLVYPVCLYYYKRAPYLFAYGQTPLNLNEIGWYDYRIDKIQNLEELSWENGLIPEELKDECLRGNPPDPEEVQERMEEALGHDWYKPQATMLLRFERSFHANYIEGTERTSLYKSISSKYVLGQIKGAKLTSKQKQYLLGKVKAHPEDVYCQVNYNVDDNNVIMRLRAWGPKVEVLFPWELRERILNDLAQTQQFYSA